MILTKEMPSYEINCLEIICPINLKGQLQFGDHTLQSYLKRIISLSHFVLLLTILNGDRGELPRRKFRVESSEKRASGGSGFTGIWQ